jgi:hypothetical protein
MVRCVCIVWSGLVSTCTVVIYCTVYGTVSKQHEHKWLRWGGAKVIQVSRTVLTEAELFSSEEGSVIVAKNSVIIV